MIGHGGSGWQLNSFADGEVSRICKEDEWR
jgi:hypothetical protein